MKQISFEEIRSLQLEILKKIDEFCIQNNLQYSLAYGSLIGAVRHKGYIPWDDDIDIMMLRRDYNIFLSNFNGVYPQLKVVSPESVPSYYAPYANVYMTSTKLVEPNIKHGLTNLGIKIDVFPVDNVPSNDSEYKRMFLQSCRINKWRRYKILHFFNQDEEVSFRFVAKKIISFFIPFCYLNKKLTKMLEQSNKESEYTDIIIWPVYKYKRFSSDLFNETIRVPFETIEVNIAKGYDGILTSIYGSYMQLPPEEQRVAQHGFTAYWKE
jgi:lipopolysaccharide cholinephosphotransferase